MANQMIALQARAPQTNSLGSMVQQNASLMNMMTQQAAAQRQAQQAQQAMEIARAGEARAAEMHAPQLSEAQVKAQKAQVEYHDTVLNNFRSHLQVLAPGDLAGAQALRDAAIAALPEMKPYMPSAELMANDPATRQRMLATAEQWTSKNIPQATAEMSITPGGGLQEVRIGGAQPGMVGSGAYELEGFALAPKATAPTAAPGAIPPPPKLADVPAPAAPNGRADALRMAHDFLDTNPIAFNPAEGGASVPPLTEQNAPQIIQAAVQSGMIDEAHVQQLRQMVGPQNDQALATWMKTNNVRIQPAGQPSMQSAEYRQPPVDYMAGGVSDAGPGAQNAMMQQAQYAATGLQAMGKDPLQAPAPGSNIQPLPRIRGEAAAGESGTQGVRVVTEPKIAGGTETAKLRAQRDADYPEARHRFETNLARIDQMLDTARRLKEHPAYRRIIGPMDAFTPNFGRARGAQQLYDTLTAQGTTEELQKMREASPTGGAVGNVSDADIMLLRQGFGAMGQDQDEADFDVSINSLIAQAKRARNRLVTQYRDAYGYKLPKNWSPPAPYATPRAKPKGAGRATGGITVFEGEEE